MLSRLTLVLSLVMIWLVAILFLRITETGVQTGKLIDPHQPLMTRSDSIDIDVEIMRRAQRIGSFTSTSTSFVKSGDIRRD